MSDTPFSDPSDNPFKGPSGAGGGDHTVQYGALDSYNPFDASGNPPKSNPAVLPPSGTMSTTAPPAYNASSSQRVTSADLEKRQQELEQRANELNRREEELLRRGEGQGSGGQSDKNWPPLPKFCPCRPCFYMDFDIEIPANRRRLVRLIYYLWIAHVIVSFINVFGTLSYFIGSQASSEAGSTFGVSIVLFVFFTPLSFVCWFRPIYKAFRSDSSFNFFMFFIVMMAQIVVVIIQCLGINWLASCGFINGLSMLGKSVGVAAFMLVIAILFAILGVLDTVILIRVHRIYRNSGASFEKAKQEFGHGVATNSTVRGFGTAAASSALSPNNNPDYRY